MTTDEWGRLTLRIPVNTHIELKVLAARNRRSLNNQIVSILEKAIAAAEGQIGVGSSAAAPNNNAALASGASITNG